MAGQPPDNRGPILFMVLLAIAGFIAVAGGLSDASGRSPEPSAPAPATTPADPSDQPTSRPKPRR